MGVGGERVSGKPKGGLQDFTGPLSQNINILLGPQLEPVRLAPMLGDLHGMPPRRPRGCVQATSN